MNRSALKLIAVIFMVMEHSDFLFSNLFGDPRVGIATHYSGRTVFPIFAFLMVEGFFKTSNLSKYVKRILLWAVIMSAGSFLLIHLVSYFSRIEPDNLFSSPVWLSRILSPIGTNIFWSLGTGILVLHLIEQIKTSKGRKRVISCILLPIVSFFTLFTEASIHVLPLFLIFYFFYNDKKYAIGAYIAFSLLWLINGLSNIDYFWTFEYQWVMIFTVPFFIYYNGSKGKYDMKYFFYIIYPLHLWILFVVERLYFPF